MLIAATLGLASAAPADAARWDVSLGGSLAAESPSPGRGFVARLHRRLADAGDLQLRDFACRGVTSASMAAARTCRGAPGSQAIRGESFLGARRGQVAVVTVEVGSSEVFACVYGDGGRPALPATGAAGDRPQPARHARPLARGRRRPGAVPRDDLHNPFRGAAARRGGRAALRSLNRHLRAIYARTRVQPVGLGGAFAGRWLCRRTHACRRRFDPRPTAAGAQAIADAFAAAVGPLPRAGAGQDAPSPPGA